MKSLALTKSSNRRLLFRISCVLACMLLLLLSPATALSGAAYGLVLWYRTLFPTLMPFMVLSNFIVYTGCARPIGIVLTPLTRLLGLPQSAGYCILTGFLCGYPMGAYVCGNLNGTGEVDDDTATFLAPLCNNVSPMFMISYICMSCLGDRRYSAAVVAILMLSAVVALVIIGIIRRFLIKKNGNKEKSSGNHAMHGSSPAGEAQKVLSTSEAITRSVEGALMASLKLCIYVMLFSIAGAMIDRIYFLPEITRAALMSLMEITAGLDKIAKLDIAFEYRFFMMLTFTAFGGMSSVLQTMSLWSGKHFDIAKYLVCKLAVTLVTALAVLLVIVVGLGLL